MVAFDSNKYIAMAIPSECGVKQESIPACFRIAEVAIGEYRYEIVSRVGKDKTCGEVGLGNVGHVDGHVVEVIASVGNIGIESESSNIASESSHMSAIDEGLNIAIVVVAVANRSVTRGAGGHSAIVAGSNLSIGADGGGERVPKAPNAAIRSRANTSNTELVGSISSKTREGSRSADSSNGGIDGCANLTILNKSIGSIAIPDYLSGNIARNC